MTVELWYGEKPTNPGEQNVLIELYDYLKSRPGHYVLMCNFYTDTGNETDLLCLKSGAIFLVELKHYWDKIIGSRQGDWKCVRRDGQEIPFGNPFLQVKKCSHAWQDWCKQYQNTLTGISGKKRVLQLYTPLEFIVFYPSLHSESEITIGDHPVQAMGLEKFRTALPIRTVNGLDFTLEELQTIPKMLKLTQWHIDPPAQSPVTIPLAGDVHPPIVRMLVPRNTDPPLKVFHIERGLVTVGRDPQCDLPINDESISRKHAEISKAEGRWVVKDLDSKNGTFVSFNGDPHTERRIESINALKNGSIVRFGQVSFTIILED